jgi:UDP-GlcNAc:undecaprenyl-phosphate GlcNAc-1-phosphate transferase
MGSLGKLAELASGNKTYWACYLLGLAATLVLTPLVIRIAQALEVVDRPSNRKIHKSPTPLLGGLSIFAGMWLPLVLLSLWDNQITRELAKGGWAELGVVFGAGLVMVLTGAVDDKWGLNARWKFAVQIPLAALLVWGGVHFEVIKAPFFGTLELGYWGPVLSVVWIVGVTNALNLIDGIDGLAAGVAFFVSGTNAIVALLNGNTLLALVMWSMAGACLGFLRYNFSPARIFLGDTGSLFLGVTLAVTSIEANAKGSVATSMAIPVLVLGYPVLDTLLSMVRRALRGKSMFTGDTGHIHHRLLARGLDQRHTALILYGVCGLFCFVGLASVLGSDVWVGLGLAAIATVFGAGLWALGYLRYFSREAAGERPLYRIAFLFSEITKERFKLAERREEIFELLREACDEFGMMGLEVSCPAGPGGGAFHARWLLEGRGRSPARKHLPQPQDAALSQEMYQFQDTGLAVLVFFPKAELGSDLQMEYRTLIGEVLAAANRRLLELTQAQVLRARLEPLANPPSTEAVSPS